MLILCGGSATDLPAQTAEYAELFHVVDSFDTHALSCGKLRRFPRAHCLQRSLDRDRILPRVLHSRNAADGVGMHFISEEELRKNHGGIPHGGFVIRSGVTGWEKENRHVIEYRLKLDSNPEFTSSVLVACARTASECPWLTPLPQKV